MAASSPSIAIVGTGPAALMAAEAITSAGLGVTIFEKRRAPGRKLLVAGSSGLNISNALPPEEFASHYSGAPPAFWHALFEDFSVRDWLDFIERDLGLRTFLGTSGRYFVREMKASGLLRAWIRRLEGRGADFAYGRELSDFSRAGSRVRLRFAQGSEGYFDAAVLALGGASWEPNETPLRWPPMFRAKGLAFEPFTPSNCGFQVAWPAGLLAEAEGLPLKSVTLSTPRGSRKGEMVITRYGIEGTPVYALGAEGEAFLDLKPDLTAAQIREKLRPSRENLSPIRRVQRKLGLSPAAQALLFHLTPPAEKADLDALVARIKRLPLTLGQRQPLTEAISSAGGLSLGELDRRFMLRRFPGAFAAGEMLDWDAPTGGFLIQACVSMGHAAGRGLVDHLRARASGSA